jgi:Ca2+-binding EF-hand superfamily protein
MVSALVKERFAALLLEMAESEKRSEITRQVLVEKAEFDAYSSFRRITTEHYGGMTLFELKEFFGNHEIQVEAYELDLLFVHLDADSDGIISWSEFLNCIMSKEYHSGCQYGRSADFNLELEHSLMRVFEQELENEIHLEARRRALWDTPTLKERTLFDLVFDANDSTVSWQGIHEFLQPYAGKNYKPAMAERIWRRMDENLNGFIHYDEFVRALRPIYCYKSYGKSVTLQKEMSPTKIYKKPINIHSKGGDEVSRSRASSRMTRGARSSRNVATSESRRVVETTEYDPHTGRPLGKKMQVVRSASFKPKFESVEGEPVRDHRDIGLNPEHPINSPMATQQRWDRVMAFNPNINPLASMHMGLHPLDTATGTQDPKNFWGVYDGS